MVITIEISHFRTIFVRNIPIAVSILPVILISFPLIVSRTTGLWSNLWRSQNVNLAFYTRCSQAWIWCPLWAFWPGTSGHRAVVFCPCISVKKDQKRASPPKKKNPTERRNHISTLQTSRKRIINPGELVVFPMALRTVNWEPLCELQTCDEQFSLFQRNVSSLMNSHW